MAGNRVDYNHSYTTTYWWGRAREMLRAHPAQTPSFWYISLQAVHSPYEQVPAALQTDEEHRILKAMEARWGPQKTWPVYGELKDLGAFTGTVNNPQDNYKTLLQMEKWVQEDKRIDYDEFCQSNRCVCEWVRGHERG